MHAGSPSAPRCRPSGAGCPGLRCKRAGAWAQHGVALRKRRSNGDALTSTPRARRASNRRSMLLALRRSCAQSTQQHAPEKADDHGIVGVADAPSVDARTRAVRSSHSLFGILLPWHGCSRPAGAAAGVAVQSCREHCARGTTHSALNRRTQRDRKQGPSSQSRDVLPLLRKTSTCAQLFDL